MNNKVENNMKEEVITDTSSISSEQSQSSISEGHKSSHYSTVGDNPAEAILASVAYILLTIGVVVSVLVGGLFIMGGNEFESKWGSLIGWVILIGGGIFIRNHLGGQYDFNKHIQQRSPNKIHTSR